MLRRRPAAAALAALTEVPAGTVDVGVRKAGSSPGSSPVGRRFALLLLVGGGLAAATGFAVQQRRASG